MFVRVCACLSGCICVWSCICECASACVCVCVSVRACVCICMFVFAKWKKSLGDNAFVPVPLRGGWDHFSGK